MFSTLSTWNQELPKTVLKRPCSKQKQTPKQRSEKAGFIPGLSEKAGFIAGLSGSSIKHKDVALALVKSFLSKAIWWCYYRNRGRRTQEACHREALALCLSLLFSPPRTALILASSLPLAPCDSFCMIPREVIFFITLLIHDEKSQRNFWKAGT